MSVAGRFFVVMAEDRPGSLELRHRLRPSHREWLREHPGHDVQVLHGGPTTDEHEAMNGTLLVVQAPDRASVERFVGADPYTQGGLFAQVTIRAWLWTLGGKEAVQ